MSVCGTGTLRIKFSGFSWEYAYTHYWIVPKNAPYYQVRLSSGTMSGGEFDWGGRLRKSIGGAQRFPQNGRKPFEECKGIRELDCETDGSSRYESRT